MSSLIIATIFIFFQTTWCQDKPTVQQVNVIFRHGDRMPELFPKRFPNDPNMFRDFAPFGSGGVTEQGKKRAFGLGAFLRAKYKDEPFEEFHAVHNESPRTLDSLTSVLSGLYQGKKNLTGKIRSLEYKNEQLYSNDRCVDFLNEYEKVLQLPEVREEFAKFAPYLEELRILCGKESPLTESDIVILQCNLDIENRINLPMKPWMKETLRNGTLNQIKQLYGSTQSYNKKLARLMAGPLLREITDNLKKVVDGHSPEDRKIFLYSCHDKNVLNTLEVLKLYEPHNPEFSSAVIFELIKFQGNYYVKMSYYLGIPPVVKNLKLPNCDELCPVKEFLKITKEFCANDEERNCEIQGDSYFDDNENKKN